MPRIKLKPNSAEYADATSKTKTFVCDMYGCMDIGQYKAPKHRGLNEYHHFCLVHVQEYNKAWNFFSGMSDDEVQDHVLKSMYGFRPTWKYGVDGHTEDIIRDRAWQFQHGDDTKKADTDPRKQEKFHAHNHSYESYSPEFQALAMMDLAPPVNLATIKKRYKELAKKFHPDLNKGCEKSEDLLKQINMAYTILKVAYEKFDELPER